MSIAEGARPSSPTSPRLAAVQGEEQTASRGSLHAHCTLARRHERRSHDSLDSTAHHSAHQPALQRRRSQCSTVTVVTRVVTRRRRSTTSVRQPCAPTCTRIPRARLQLATPLAHPARRNKLSLFFWFLTRARGPEVDGSVGTYSYALCSFMDVCMTLDRLSFIFVRDRRDR